MDAYKGTQTRATNLDNITRENSYVREKSRAYIDELEDEQWFEIEG
ncbi:hypothetical protein LINGRAHAP2_LOCUS33248 [Linum grandiflorum]